MTLSIQDPNGFSNNILHESILELFKGAEVGGGAFAFASKDGVELLLGSNEFKEFIEKGNFFLIIGIDEITNNNALSALLYYQEIYPNLTIKAFYHQNKGRLFHPKFLWVKTGELKGSIITGSGNLTTRGLRDNWEAYYTATVENNDFKQIFDFWKSWIDGHINFLLNLTEEVVISRVGKNIFKRTKNKSTSSKEGNEVIPKIVTPSGDNVIRNNGALLLEWPKGRTGVNAYSQVNFGKELFESYFNIKIDEKLEEHFFQNVNEDGTLGITEVRPPVIKLVSTNFNFELDAPKGRGREEGQPIGVFVKIGVRTYRYSFIMPKDNFYNEFKELLENNAEAIGNRKRRFITNEDTIFNAIPDCDFLYSLVGDEV